MFGLQSHVVNHIWLMWYVAVDIERVKFLAISNVRSDGLLMKENGLTWTEEVISTNFYLKENIPILL